uniref:Receptor kinase-like protein Xa21 n=1 Tax=Oryza meridionalis TaxID=40149 RepID=A0A0E0E370_9ORYZ
MSNSKYRHCLVATSIRSRLPLAVILSYLLSFFASSSGATTLYDQPSIEFQSLLCLKLHLTNTDGILATWKNDSHQFCDWSGVTCSKRNSSRVVALELESFDLDGQIPPCIANLTFLTRIHLADNQLSGEIPRELGQLNKLQYLNLSSNKLRGKIPDTLSSCHQLQTVDLGSNNLQGEIPQNLRHCLNLQVLNLDFNMLTGGIPEELGMLQNLSVLHLAGNSLTGGIPLSLGSTSSLVSVILANNSLTGPIPSLLANSSSLQVLSLTRNNLTGEIPPALFNSTSLRKLALGVNNFVGTIPTLMNIDSPLQYFIVQSNDLAGTIPSTIGNFSSLLWLLLGANNFEGSIPTSIGTIPDLQILDFSYNLLSGTVPASIYNMSELTYLGMGKNSLTGKIPYSIGYTLPSIQTLIMQANQFQGQIPISLANGTNLVVINLRDNAFQGVVPSFGTLTNLVELDLGKNRLEAGDWSFLSSLTNCTQLVRLLLDSNILEGVLPGPGTIASLSKNLELLLLTENKIFGTIPKELEHLTNLSVLYLDRNLLTGNIPVSLGNLQNLFDLRLSQNKLSGQIPRSIGNLNQLSELHLEENYLSGSIPEALGRCKNLEIMNLSYNSFNGTMPREVFTLSSLSRGLDLSHNKLSGRIPLEISGLINLGPLDISNNQLSGQIPSTIGECVHLETLHMEGNRLDGTIPDSFSNLRGITVLDLSQNNLSGEIPRFLDSFNNLRLLNLSFNNLEGQVPTGGIFENASEVFIQGNQKLCASTQMLQVPLCNTNISKQRHNSNVVKTVVFTALPLVLLSCFALILLKKRKKVKQDVHQSCNDGKNFSYADLDKATNGFSSANMVGSGKYGSVYRGVFEFEQQVVAIKVFKLDQHGGPKSFLAECEALRNTRHRNLVSVITACSTFDPIGHEFKALILDYMPNGNLENWLHLNHITYGLNIQLSFASRITIAADIAAALDYLHNYCVPPIVHCDLKPSNVLIDDAMGARLGDFGLSKFLHSYSSSTINSSTSLSGPRGSIGYIAPEYGFGSKISTEGDVYSYGIIILEMLTGKRPTDGMFNDGMSLHKFVEKAFPHNIGKIIDPNIMPNLEDEQHYHETVRILSCITQLAKLGLSCSVEIPKDRPVMQEVYAEVVEIKETFLELQG